MSTPQDPFATPPQGGATPSTPSSAPPPSGPAWGAPAPGSPAPDASAPGSYGSGYGAPTPPGGYGGPGPQGTSNGMGIAALVLGLIGLFTSFFVIGGLFGILAIVLGVLGLGKVKRGEASGKGLPVAGIVLGVVSVLIAGAVIAFGIWFANSDAGQELADCLSEAAGDPAAEAECQREFEDSLSG